MKTFRCSSAHLPEFQLRFVRSVFKKTPHSKIWSLGALTFPFRPTLSSLLDIQRPLDEANSAGQISLAINK